MLSDWLRSRLAPHGHLDTLHITAGCWFQYQVCLETTSQAACQTDHNNKPDSLRNRGEGGAQCPHWHSRTSFCTSSQKLGWGWLEEKSIYLQTVFWGTILTLLDSRWTGIKMLQKQIIFSFHNFFSSAKTFIFGWAVPVANVCRDNWDTEVTSLSFPSKVQVIHFTISWLNNTGIHGNFHIECMSAVDTCFWH